jgi:hypothetical protein
MAKFSTADVIKYSAYITEKHGYIKRSDDPNVECTADSVFNAMIDHSISDDELIKMNERIIAWSEYIKSFNKDNEYITNVLTEISKPMIDESKIGLIASSFSSFDKHNKYNTSKNDDKNSVFLGEEGDTIIFNISSYMLIKTGISKYNNAKWYLYKIKDDNDNVIMYFANYNCDDEFKSASKASAVVSKLTTFNEVKQTNVSKLKFL